MSVLKQKIIFICIGYILAVNLAHAAYDQRSILNEMNSYRQQHHLSSLKMNSLISDEAEKHSQRMAQHRIPLGHQDFKKRARMLFHEFKHSRGIAENVAYAYSGTEDVVKQWLSSPGHRKNIEGNYNLTGIGIASDKKGRIYVTQIFLRTI